MIFVGNDRIGGKMSKKETIEDIFFDTVTAAEVVNFFKSMPADWPIVMINEKREPVPIRYIKVNHMNPPCFSLHSKRLRNQNVPFEFRTN